MSSEATQTDPIHPQEQENDRILHHGSESRQENPHRTEPSESVQENDFVLIHPSLPEDISLILLGLLNPQELLSYIRVCKSWKKSLAFLFFDPQFQLKPLRRKYLLSPVFSIPLISLQNFCDQEKTNIRGQGFQQQTNFCDQEKKAVTNQTKKEEKLAKKNFFDQEKKNFELYDRAISIFCSILFSTSKCSKDDYIYMTNPFFMKCLWTGEYSISEIQNITFPTVFLNCIEESMRRYRGYSFISFIKIEQ